MKDPDVERFGERVRDLRLERRLSVDTLAGMIKMTPAMVYQIEAGTSPPSFQKMLAIAHALKVDPVFLFVYPHLTPVHDLVELARKANKKTVDAMKASCEGLVAGLKIRQVAER